MKTLTLVVILLVGGCVSKNKSEFIHADLDDQELRSKNVVVVSHPKDQDSEKAFKEIPEEVSEYLEDNALFIAPSVAEKALDDRRTIAAWNQTSPLKHILVSRNAKVDPIDLGTTPQFYFFNKGKLKAKIVGWPDNGKNLSLLKETIEAQKKGSL